ncbi:hypothetical protein VA7868_00946 [Vibrio aerogenes CECT 7868]|uniref:Lysozyme inhibitor LprI-like N-terminal domain-containing protein n=1 Tax=Vibrio aerogenes CECT 7868 TaxID=1216006 RepID=A0A1M5X2J2_9VIBR|nr:lysozyme inhibitor LprI family protein [Vibrio aerogenes]SHH94009.1 hypothetical protein VA7868_00946 [Vibrio aerogenes CECT 7868]
MRRLSVLGLVLTIACPGSLWAKSEFDVMYDACINESGPINNSVVYMCSERASQQAKDEINRRYVSVYAKLKKQGKEEADKLENAQKGWLKYRNNYCELKGLYVGSPMYAYCPMRMNISRALELRTLDENIQ